MASTAADLSTPTARAKSVVGSTITAETITAPVTKPVEKVPIPRPPESTPPETMGTPTARVPEGAPVPAGTQKITDVAPSAVSVGIVNSRAVQKGMTVRTELPNVMIDTSTRCAARESLSRLSW